MGDGLFKRGHIWFAWVNGHRVSTGLRDKQAAAKKRDELERRAVDPAYALGREATGQQIFDNYARSRRRLGRSAGTMHHVETKMGNLLRLLPVKCDDWNLAEFEKYVDDRLKEGVRRTTIKKELRVALAALRHARKHHLFDRAPEDIIPELDDDYEPRTRFVTPWELVALATALDATGNEPGRAAHAVYIVATSARWSESLRARRAHVNFKTLMVDLLGSKTKASTRSVPIVGPSEALLRWSLARGGEDKLFAPWPNVRRSLLAACKRAGIAPVSPNDLRRTCSTWLQQGGTTNDLIAKVMGHTSSRMVEKVYGRIPMADVARLLRERIGGGLSDEGVRDGGRKDDGEPEGTGENQGGSGHGGTAGAGLLLGALGAANERARHSPVGTDGGILASHYGVVGTAAQEHPGRSDSRGEMGARTGGVTREDDEETDPQEGGLITGLLMGSKQVFSGRSEGISVITEKAVSPEKNQAFGSAQRQNRTADTGIFNPPESAANTDESRDYGAGWVAGGSTSVDRLIAACPPPSVALDLARFARDAAWDAAEQAVRRELIARRRYLPQFVGAVRGEFAS